MPKRKHCRSRSRSGDGDAKTEKPEFAKSVLVLHDLKLNPVCSHGPQVCFEKNGKRFYSCSAFRSPHECQKNSEKVQNKQSNSGLAQYLFTTESTKFLSSLIVQLKLRHVLCLGVPSLHTQLIESGIDSFLLDMDLDMVERTKPHASHYNMCNHYFFESDADYNRFLLSNTNELTVIMDPPFSAKPELLTYVHSLIKQDFMNVHGTRLNKDGKILNLKISDSSNSINDNGTDNTEGTSVLKACQEFNVIWVSPYFMEGHLKKSNPNFNMSDFQVNYTNHSSFSAGKNQSRKDGSPIRIFTNIALSQIKLPEDNYKWCNLCSKYVVRSNEHCNKCGSCTSKDGKTYKHCDPCKKCVKPTWSHCNQCEKCALSLGHTC